MLRAHRSRVRLRPFQREAPKPSARATIAGWPSKWARTAGSTCLTVEGRRVRVRAGTDAARAGALVAVAEPERPDPIHAQFLARVQLPTWDATDVPWDQRRIEHAPPSSRGDWQTNRPRIGCSSAVVAPTRLGSFELLTGAALLQPACGLTNDSGHRETDADAPPSPHGVLPSDGARTVPLNGSTVRYVRDAGRPWRAQQSRRDGAHHGAP